jgi:hypothetical protein
VDALREDDARRPAQLPSLPATVIRHLELHRPRARAVVVLFIVVHAVLAFAETSSLAQLPLIALSFVAVSGAAVLVASPGDDPLGPGRSALVLALCGVAAAGTLSSDCVPCASQFAYWEFGAITLVLVILAVRGRPSAAWSAYAVIFCLTIPWAVHHGAGLGDIAGLLVRHAATLLAGTLFAVGIRRTARSVELINQARASQASEYAETVAAIEEREAQRVRLNAMARPMLERLADSADLDDEDRAASLQVEASLRDAMRGRSLFVEPMISAARAARRRGVEVTLIDDGGDPGRANADAVAAVLARQLDGVATGSFTARLLPDGRADLATVVIATEGRSRMLAVTANLAIRDA